MARRLREALTFMLLSACGGIVVLDDPAGQGGNTASEEPFVTQACLDYCAAVADKPTCSEGEDCHQRCMSLYAKNCNEEIEGLLACMPDWILHDCVMGYPDDPLGGCSAPLHGLTLCSLEFVDCQTNSGLLDDGLGCESSGICAEQPVEIRCDSNQNCTCVKGGTLLGECAMPFGGAEACDTQNSCCRSLFGY